MLELELTKNLPSNVVSKRGLRRYCNLLEDSDFGINNFNKGEYIMNNTKGLIKYKMPAALAKEYIKSRKGAEARMNQNDFLCKIVNEEYNLLGYCVEVILY